MKVEAATTLVVPGFTEEGRVLAGFSDDVLNRHLEKEGSVGCVEGFAMPEVDFVLARTEFVIASEHPDVHLVEHTHEVKKVTVGVDESTGLVDAPRSVDCAFVPATLGDVGDIELEFGSHDRLQAERVVFGDYLLQHRSRGNEIGGVVCVQCVGDNISDPGLERKRSDGVRFHRTDKVLQSIGQDLYGIEDVAASRCHPNPLGECGAAVRDLV